MRKKLIKTVLVFTFLCLVTALLLYKVIFIQHTPLIQNFLFFYGTILLFSIFSTHYAHHHVKNNVQNNETDISPCVINYPLKKGALAVLIPCHNEEKMISSCIDSCLTQTKKPDEIIVINDGSTDKSKEILETYGDKIKCITIEKATGNKSRAQEIGIQSVTCEFVIATDGDTILDPKFIELVLKDFTEDPELAVVAGYVQSMKYNFLTALREIDYTIGQDLNKVAQWYVNFLLVIPGCAGAFKTKLFRDGSICFDHDTLTEDLDFTYKLNELNHKIKFNRKAKVYTQDPPTIHSYINQMRRWYGGAWQNLKKHHSILKSKPSAALILSLSYFEGLFF